MGEGGAGITRFRKDREGSWRESTALGPWKRLLGWSICRLVGDILIERLKYGRGKRNQRAEARAVLEDFAEEIVKAVFGDGHYDTRCRFVGATGMSTEKADFAVPNKQDPRILIEVKGYGATGSKQTDILGDIERIANQKRPDTHLLLITDGVTWRSRKNDLSKLIDWQNRGRITRIYTQLMAAELEADLRQLRLDHSLG